MRGESAISFPRLTGASSALQLDNVIRPRRQLHAGASRLANQIENPLNQVCSTKYQWQHEQCNQNYKSVVAELMP